MASGLQNPYQSGPHLLKLISEQKLEPKQLTTHQRRICVRFLLQQGSYTQFEIAQILHIPEVYVYRDKKKIQEQNQWMLDDLDERRIAVDIIQTAERSIARLSKASKQKEAWTVAREMVEVLQTLGYLKRAPIEFKGQVTLEEILKLAAGHKDDENGLLRGTGQRAPVLTNGSH